MTAFSLSETPRSIKAWRQAARLNKMQDAGVRTSQLDQIVRQRKNPALLEAVQHLAKGETAEGIKMLAEQGRVTQIANPNERTAAIAKDYAAAPENTIIVSPDNRSRQLINEAARGELKGSGKLVPNDQHFRFLLTAPT